MLTIDGKRRGCTHTFEKKLVVPFADAIKISATLHSTGQCFKFCIASWAVWLCTRGSKCTLNGPCLEPGTFSDAPTSSRKCFKPSYCTVTDKLSRTSAVRSDNSFWLVLNRQLNDDCNDVTLSRLAIAHLHCRPALCHGEIKFVLKLVWVTDQCLVQ